MPKEEILNGEFIVIYDHPTDYPDSFIARKFHIVNEKPVANTVIFSRGDTLKDVRRTIPKGMGQVKRHGSDELSIVETWIPLTRDMLQGLKKQGKI